jgi:hypothetical protein
MSAMTGWESFILLQQQEGKVQHFSGDGEKNYCTEAKGFEKLYIPWQQDGKASHFR